jgi:hypothetical protein
MATGINKTITLDGVGGLQVSYWRLDVRGIRVGTDGVNVIMVPFLNSSADTGGAQPAMQFARRYSMTLAQAGFTATSTGGAAIANYLRDTILNWLLNNESDFTGGTLI